MKKSGIILITFIIIALLMTSCGKKTEQPIDGENISQDNTIDNDNENTEDKNIDGDNNTLTQERPLVLNLDSRTRLLMGDNAEKGLMFYSSKWLDNNKYIFQHSVRRDNAFYIFDTESNKLEKTLDLTGEYWWIDVVGNGNGVIYSEDGFNGLYYYDNKEPIKIMDRQSWYNISPDGKTMIVNGFPADSDGTEYKRYIYDIKSKELKYTSLIPDMDYVFSYLAARWSPDSIHVSSQDTDKSHTLKIINAVENKVKKKITKDDAIISFPSWSPDGKNIVFLVQSKGKEDYFLVGEEMGFYMSDILGIYNIHNNSVEYVSLGDNLTISNIIWDVNGKGFYFPTVTIEDAKKILNKNGEDNAVEGYIDVKYTLNYFALNENKFQKILDSNIFRYYNSILLRIQPLNIYNDDTLIYSFDDGEKHILKAYDTKTQKDVVIYEFDDWIGILQYYIKDDLLVLAFNNGVAYVDKELKLNIAFDFKKYTRDKPTYAYFSPSPDFKKAFVGIEYYPGSNEENFYEIIDLDW